MNPIDQIRKALEDYVRLRNDKKSRVSQRVVAASVLNDLLKPSAIAALLASHDAAVQRAAKFEKQVEVVTNLANAAMKGSAAMQERCAQVCEAEHLEDPQGEPDAAYDRAVDHCAAAIRAIKE